MCGIGGYIDQGMDRKEKEKVVDNLLSRLKARGTDATGIYTDGYIFKDNIDADKFRERYIGSFSLGETCMLHTRLQTHGTHKKKENNHPVKGNRFALTHNGVVSSMPRLNDYNYQGKVDTEILLSYLEKKGIKNGLKQKRGRAAVAFVDEEADDVKHIYLWRDFISPTVISEVDGKGTFYASTEDILGTALKKTFRDKDIDVEATARNALIKITENGVQEIETIESMTSMNYGTTFRQNRKRSNSKRVRIQSSNDDNDGIKYGGYGYRLLETIYYKGRLNESEILRNSGLDVSQYFLRGMLEDLEEPGYVEWDTDRYGKLVYEITRKGIKKYGEITKKHEEENVKKFNAHHRNKERDWKEVARRINEAKYQ